MSSQLKKNLLLIIVTVLLSAVISLLVFRILGAAQFAKMRLNELEPKAEFLSGFASDFILGIMDDKQFEHTINTHRRVWDADVYVYDESHNLIAWTDSKYYNRNIELVKRNIDFIYDDYSINDVDFFNGNGVVVGVPIYDTSDNIIGGLFLVKTAKEVNLDFIQYMMTFGIGSILSIVLMAVPVYFISKRITDPIMSMNNAALAMAKGDYSVRAHEDGNDEVSQLGHSLNKLSETLEYTIGELTLERNQLSETLNGLVEGVVSIGGNGDVLTVNPAAHMLLGCENTMIETSDVFQSIRGEIEKVSAGKNEQIITFRSFRDRMLMFIITSIGKTKESDAGNSLVLIRDVTESERLEQTRRDYIANVSHELRTPIASIRTLADALVDNVVKNDADKLRYYGYMQKESIRLGKLIDDLLELSRLQSGGVALTKTVMDISELLYDVAQRFETMASERGTSIVTSVDVNCPEAYSNSDRCEQVLVALLDNAIKHSTNSGGIVDVEAHLMNDKIYVSVTNDGVIDEADIDHIFERFYKADKSHSGEGTGLGLSISKEIMRLLDEDIFVASDNGKVTFAFTVSVAK